MKSVCVYCGSSPGNHADFARAAKAMGLALAERGITLVYGGGAVGLMGLVADACLEAGGRVTGIIPEFLAIREVAHSGVTDMRVVASMHERKAMMEQLSDAFIALPGGQRFLRLEDLLLMHLPTLFPGYRDIGHCAFRVLRDSDLEVEDEAEDLVREFETALKRRRRGQVMRLKMTADAPLMIDGREALRLVGLGLMALAKRLPHPKRAAPRMALANLHRPGALTPSVVLSLGLGVTLLVALSLIDANVRRALTGTLPASAPTR